MTDEKHAFISDLKDKKVTARSARHTRTHCGKGGKVRLPSDNLSKKELQKMNGECKSYRLNEPMAWQEFKAMPDDIQVAYIKALKAKFNVTITDLAVMFGCHRTNVGVHLAKLGFEPGKGGTPKRDKEGFYAWMHGGEKLPVPVPEEAPVQEEQLPVITNQEPEPYLEDDLPFEEPATDPFNEITDLKIQIIQLAKENEELKAVNEKTRAELDWLRKECDSQRMNAKILEAQMDVVRLIFGGKNNA